MSYLKNIRLIEDQITVEELKKLDTGARLYRQHGRIEFKINSIDDDQIEIRIIQNKNPTENYLTRNELIERAKNYISPFFPDLKINVKAYEYKLPVVNVVTSGWIRWAMNENKISLKKITFDTGIDKTSLSAVVNGKKPLSQSMKAVFYYYFANEIGRELLSADYSNNEGGFLLIPRFIEKAVIDTLVEKISNDSKRKVALTDRADTYCIQY